jgi:glycosyltransferase involved in cell wall biosynthesis
MRILLSAYNYPPLSTTHSKRWYYLSRELARLCVEVHVLAPDLPTREESALEVPPGVTVHRCEAGGVTGWLARMQRGRAKAASNMAPARRVSAERPATAVTLNWKGRALRLLKRLVGLYCFPDASGQWRRPARLALERLLDGMHPDLLISSHEPAVTLELGLSVASRVPAWLVDLGDPVLAPYTPVRWRPRAARLERVTCRMADAVVVTTAATGELLRARHDIAATKLLLLSQGFDDSVPRLPTKQLPGKPLLLLYSGRFYRFRDPKPLLDAVLALEGVRLTVVAPEVAPELLSYAPRSMGRIVFTGEQPHAQVLAWQRDCDVLVNIGNALPAQMPGKLVEYLGSGKPILHCQATYVDPAVALLQLWRCGWACRNESTSLQVLLGQLVTSPQRIVDMAAGDAEAIAGQGWSQLGAKLLAHFEQLVAAADRK